MNAFIITFAMLVLGTTCQPVVLTANNFDKEVFSGGKNAFVKFFAPWCGHCKGMKPAWDQLGAELAGSNSVLIGDVDCTVEKDLCSRFDVKGYPTIKYWNSDAGKDGIKYSGGRDFQVLRDFVKDSLEVLCQVSNPDTCTEREQDYITKVQSKTSEERDKELARLQGMVGNKMTPAQKTFLMSRTNILTQLQGEASKE
jgi:protein disulfide-isomerase A6|eukprot:CAMPEP_0174285104 /NCGR_PEP_ID=MMETSP0809-20121228/7627_1 /TAXON_ID=73025 ORGANISM="Eutreptiella gymnastica-like, Strain CCMP1594" /NCGR_SAMPLE_ID=MMETSP0809 /ASSEMBLY_ACC=CAM_ASM_000658 /LENGTH=197 /DNA_ID=CAMNT_0015380795 /DNA_START=28 /DNA_END=621 /DNA_ORIENTATION=+